jgi:general secretion pathway protein D
MKYRFCRAGIFGMRMLIAFVTAASTLFLAGGCTTPPAKNSKQTFSSFDLPSEHAAKDMVAPVSIDFQGVPVAAVLKTYQEVSGRTVVHGPLAEVVISLRSQTPLNRIQALQMLDTALAQHGITMVLSGDNTVIAVPAAKVFSESPPNIMLPWKLLPDSSSYMMRTIQLKNVQAQEVQPALQPFAKLPNSILAYRDPNLLILRDYSANIRQELRLLEELERKFEGRPMPQRSNKQ